MHLASDWLPPGKLRPQLKVGETLPPRVRTTQFALKDRRTLFTDAEIGQARDNITRFPSASKLAEEIIRAADYWRDWADEDLRRIIPAAEVPRAFDCSTAGCPKCGKKIFEFAKSTYPWRLDPHRPFKVQCPICESVFPSNDYERYYRSGFVDRRGFDGPYVDDGRGWVAPDGERYWFVAHANHWTWYWHPQADNPSLIRACEALGRAYVLTGDRRYAHKAAVILHRVAEVYPNMDHATQSRQGEIMAQRYNEAYSGKVVNAIWESYLSAQFAETYDAIWETIDTDEDLHRQTGCTGPELRGFIEANLLEEIIDAYYEVKTRGNYGMHQRSLLQTALVRQHADTARYVADVLDKPDGAIFLGLRYALYNLVWRDGHPYEVGDYNFTWVSNIMQILGLLDKLGVDTKNLPRIARVLDAPLDSICAGTNTPAIGDSKSVHAGIVGEDADVYQMAWALLQSPRYARFLTGFGAVGEGSFQSFGSLLHPPVPEAASRDARRHAVQASRLQSGFGLSILNNPSDSTACSVYHGLHLNHRHFDRLQLDIFAHGRAMLPDLGYPDAMNSMVPGIFTWSLSTISHNTVTVDAVMQPGNVAGVVEMQVDGPWVRAVAINAPGTYPQCPVYRRTVVMLAGEGERSVLVDFFEVEGGRQHDYSLHGPPGDFVLNGGAWSEPAPGTLAGEQVQIGEIYDDPELAATGDKTGYMNYRGSGFQHLTRVRRHQTGDWSADYTHEHDSAAQINLRILPQAGQEVMLAEARVTPVKWPQTLRYLIARRQAVTGDLCSKFVSVLEPHTGASEYVDAQRHDLPNGTAVVLTKGDGATLVILHGAPGLERTWESGEVVCRSDARIAVFGRDVQGGLQRLWFCEGTLAAQNDQIHRGPSGWVGRVSAFDPLAQKLKVTFDEPVEPSDLAGRVVHFGPKGESANTIVNASASGGDYALELRDDVMLGLVRLRSVLGTRLETASKLMLGTTLVGAGVWSKAGAFLGRVATVGDDWIELLAPPAGSVAIAGEDVWLTQVSPGDSCRIPASHAWQR